jgi:general stress protein YciG
MEAEPKKRGFAAMSPERRREIASKGGASVPNEKRAFSKDKELAAEAGRKGGNRSRRGGRPPIERT